MADEFDTYVAAVVVKLKTITTFLDVTAYVPNSIAGIQAAVIMDTGAAAQRYTQKHGYEDVLLIQCYIPIGVDPKTAEETARKLWMEIVSVFMGDVDVGATTVKVGRLEYDAGWGDVAEVYCRILEVRLPSLNILLTTYA